MSFIRTVSFASALLVLVLVLVVTMSALAQENVKNFSKDGLSFDYPAKWQLAEKSSGQMQFIELAEGDVIIRVRSPREWLKTPEKEAAAVKLFQEKYVSDFSASLEQMSMHPKRTPVTTQIAGADAEGARVRAVLDGVPGGMDSYYRIISDRLVQLSILSSEKDLVLTAPAWDMIRNSLKVEPPPTPTPKPSPARSKP
jgi:hypothetical protein